MGSKSPTQTTTVNTPPPQVLAEYQQVTNQANQVAATPYTPYTGQLVAPVNAQQNTGIGNVNNYANAAQPYLTGAAGLTLAGAGPANAQQFSPAALNQYLSPYNQDVINATQAAFQNQNTQQAQSLEGQTIGAGAFGGDRAGVAQGILAGQQQTAEAPVIAGLENQNYTQALGEFNTQQGVNLSAEQANLARLQGAGLQLGNIGTAAQTAGLQGAGAQLQAGTLQQQTQQAADTAAYNQFLQQQAYPFQTTQFEANIAEGIGSNSGGTSTSTTSAPNSVAPYIGAGLGLLSLAARGGRIPYRGGGLVIDARHRFAGGGGLVIPYASNEQNVESWVPQSPLPLGRGMGIPNAMNPANSNQQNQNIQNMTSIGQGIGKLSNSGVGDAISDFAQDFSFADGGLVLRRPGYDDGGLTGALTYGPTSPYGVLQSPGGTFESPAMMQEALAANGAPLPPPRPAGLIAPPSNSLDTATVAPVAASAAMPVGYPIQLPGGGLTMAGANSGSWAAPAYAGPAPKGAAPNPSDYPVTQAGQAAFIRDYSAYAGGGRGVDPNFALSVGNAEGLGAISPNNPNGASSVDIDPATGKPFSFGAFQLNVRNGLGNLARAAGIEPTDPAQANLANKFALDYMATSGLQPWRGDEAVRAYQGAAPVSHAMPPAFAGVTPGAGLTTGATAPTAPPPDASTPPQRSGLFGLNLSDPVRAGLLSAAFGIMASPSRNLAMAIGQGGQQGVATYEKMLDQVRQQSLTKAEIANYQSEIANRPQDIALRSRALDLQASLIQRQLAAGSAFAGAPGPSVGGAAQPIGSVGAGAPAIPPANSASVDATPPLRGAPPPTAAPASAAPASPLSNPNDPFWSDVDPAQNIPGILARSRQVAASGDIEHALQMQNQARELATTGVMKNGQLTPIPGATAMQTAKLQAAEAAKVPAAIAQAAGIEKIKPQIAAYTTAANDAETGQAMLSQADAMRSVMFDPQTGAPRVQTGPLGPLWNRVAALGEQLGISNDTIKAFTGTDPNDAQSLEKFKTALGSESARQDLTGQRLTQSEWKQYLQSVPNSEILPTAFKFLLDNAMIPKAQQMIGTYDHIKNMDPATDNILKESFEYKQTHPWFSVPAAASQPQTTAAQPAAAPSQITPEMARAELARRAALRQQQQPATP